MRLAQKNKWQCSIWFTLHVFLKKEDQIWTNSLLFNLRGTIQSLLCRCFWSLSSTGSAIGCGSSRNLRLPHHRNICSFLHGTIILSFLLSRMSIPKRVQRCRRRGREEIQSSIQKGHCHEQSQGQGRQMNRQRLGRVIRYATVEIRTRGRQQNALINAN